MNDHAEPISIKSKNDAITISPYENPSTNFWVVLAALDDPIEISGKKGVPSYVSTQVDDLK